MVEFEPVTHSEQRNFEGTLTFELTDTLVPTVPARGSPAAGRRSPAGAACSADSATRALARCAVNPDDLQELLEADAYRPHNPTWRD
jgi:hypothetical protein